MSWPYLPNNRNSLQTAQMNYRASLTGGTPLKTYAGNGKEPTSFATQVIGSGSVQINSSLGAAIQLQPTGSYTLDDPPITDGSTPGQTLRINTNSAYKITLVNSSNCVLYRDTRFVQGGTETNHTLYLIWDGSKWSEYDYHGLSYRIGFPRGSIIRHVGYFRLRFTIDAGLKVLDGRILISPFNTQLWVNETQVAYPRFHGNNLYELRSLDLKPLLIEGNNIICLKGERQGGSSWPTSLNIQILGKIILSDNNEIDVTTDSGANGWLAAPSSPVDPADPDWLAEDYDDALWDTPSYTSANSSAYHAVCLPPYASDDTGPGRLRLTNPLDAQGKLFAEAGSVSIRAEMPENLLPGGVGRIEYTVQTVTPTSSPGSPATLSNSIVSHDVTNKIRYFTMPLGTLAEGAYAVSASIYNQAVGGSLVATRTYDTLLVGGDFKDFAGFTEIDGDVWNQGLGLGNPDFEIDCTDLNGVKGDDWEENFFLGIYTIGSGFTAGHSFSTASRAKTCDVVVSSAIGVVDANVTVTGTDAQGNTGVTWNVIIPANSGRGYRRALLANTAYDNRIQSVSSVAVSGAASGAFQIDPAITPRILSGLGDIDAYREAYSTTKREGISYKIPLASEGDFCLLEIDIPDDKDRSIAVHVGGTNNSSFAQIIRTGVDRSLTHRTVTERFVFVPFYDGSGYVYVTLTTELAGSSVAVSALRWYELGTTLPLLKREAPEPRFVGGTNERGSSDLCKTFGHLGRSCLHPDFEGTTDGYWPITPGTASQDFRWRLCQWRAYLWSVARNACLYGRFAGLNAWFPGALQYSSTNSPYTPGWAGTEVGDDEVYFLTVWAGWNGQRVFQFIEHQTNSIDSQNFFNIIDLSNEELQQYYEFLVTDLGRNYANRSGFGGVCFLLLPDTWDSEELGSYGPLFQTDDNNGLSGPEGYSPGLITAFENDYPLISVPADTMENRLTWIAANCPDEWLAWRGSYFHDFLVSLKDALQTEAPGAELHLWFEAKMGVLDGTSLMQNVANQTTTTAKKTLYDEFGMDFSLYDDETDIALGSSFLPAQRYYPERAIAGYQLEFRHQQDPDLPAILFPGPRRSAFGRHAFEEFGFYFAADWPMSYLYCSYSGAWHLGRAAELFTAYSRYDLETLAIGFTDGPCTMLPFEATRQMSRWACLPQAPMPEVSFHPDLASKVRVRAVVDGGQYYFALYNLTEQDQTVQVVLENSSGLTQIYNDTAVSTTTFGSSKTFTVVLSPHEIRSYTDTSATCAVSNVFITAAGDLLSVTARDYALGLRNQLNDADNLIAIGLTDVPDISGKIGEAARIALRGGGEKDSYNWQISHTLNETLADIGIMSCNAGYSASIQSEFDTAETIETLLLAGSFYAAQQISYAGINPDGTADGATWVDVPPSPRYQGDYYDLAAHWGHQNDIAGYSCVAFNVPRTGTGARDITLRVGGLCGLKMWLDGVQVVNDLLGKNSIYRLNSYTASLSEGWHFVVIKTASCSEGFGFRLQIRGSELVINSGGTLTGLSRVTDVGTSNGILYEPYGVTFERLYYTAGAEGDVQISAEDDPAKNLFNWSGNHYLWGLGPLTLSGDSLFYSKDVFTGFSSGVNLSINYVFSTPTAKSSRLQMEIQSTNLGGSKTPGSIYFRRFVQTVDIATDDEGTPLTNVDREVWNKARDYKVSGPTSYGIPTDSTDQQITAASIDDDHGAAVCHFTTWWGGLIWIGADKLAGSGTGILYVTIYRGSGGNCLLNLDLRYSVATPVPVNQNIDAVVYIEMEYP